MDLQLDPRFTFETFEIGPGNRLAASAARRSAESPGIYNPLVIYGPSGVGKTHLLQAMAALAVAIQPELRVVYEPLERFVDRLSAALAADRLEAFRKDYLGVDLLLLDDAQFLAGRIRTQEELLPIWDAMGRNGAQVVLAADRPPTEIDALDVRLGARFARGLIVDLTRPGREATGGAAPWRATVPPPAHTLGSGEPAASRAAVPSVATPEGDDPFGSFLDDIAATVAEVVDAAPWRNVLAEAILRWEGEGMRTRRLEAALEADTAPDVEALIDGFAADAERLREIARELSARGAPAAHSPVLRDPDRRAEAEALLLAARLEHDPLPAPPPALTLANFAGRDAEEAPALVAARRMAARIGADAAPLFVHGSAERGAHLLAGIANAAAGGGSAPRVAYLDGAGLAEELRHVLEARQLELWRQRYERAELFLLHHFDALLGEEPLQEALLGLLDALLQAGAHVALAATAPPRELAGLDPRLLSRIEGGRVVDLDAAAPRRLLNSRLAPPPRHAAAARLEGPDTWFFDDEKLAWHWVALEDRLVEELR